MASPPAVKDATPLGTMPSGSADEKVRWIPYVGVRSVELAGVDPAPKSAKHDLGAMEVARDAIDGALGVLESSAGGLERLSRLFQGVSPAHKGFVHLRQPE